LPLFFELRTSRLVFLRLRQALCSGGSSAVWGQLLEIACFTKGFVQ